VKRLSQIIFLAAVLVAGIASKVSAEPILAPKQLLIVKPGVDKLHGTWLAAVINRDAKPEMMRVPVLLPKETEDFQPMEGLAAGDVKIELDGVYVEKVFSPGVNVISFAFVTSSKSGVVDLNLEAKLDLGELTLMTPRGMMKVQGEKLVMTGTDVQDLQTYDLWVTQSPVIKGDNIKVTVSGVPEGRRRLWILGVGFALVLILAATGLVFWSHPMSRREANSDMVQGDI
jgi:hypothetical protein